MIKQDRGIPFSQTAIGTTSVVATQTPTATQSLYLTDVSASTDTTTGTVTLVVASAGTTLWRASFGSVTALFYNHSFVEPIGGISGGTITATVTGGGQLFANISGFIIDKGNA